MLLFLLLLAYCCCFLSGDISWSDFQQINKTETKRVCQRETLIAIIKIQCQNGQSSRLSFPIEMDRAATGACYCRGPTMNGGGSPRGIRLQPEPRLLSRLQLQLFECKLLLPYAVSQLLLALEFRSVAQINTIKNPLNASILDMKRSAPELGINL